VPIAVSVDTAVELARTHLTEARRSVSALRPDVGRRRRHGDVVKTPGRYGPADKRRAR
jgi:signal transduction histidine kinase